MNPLGEITNTKRIYTRRNPDPNLPKVVEDPKNILRRSNNKASKGIFHLQKSLSLLVECIKIINDIILDKKFKQTLLRSKFASKLSQVTFGLERLVFSRSAQEPSQPSSISVFPQAQAAQSADTPVAFSPTLVSPPLVYIPLLLTHSIIVPNPLEAMASRFTPLVFPAQLHDLPKGYSQKNRTFGAEGDITSQQHLDSFNDCIDLEEVDHEDAKMILFS